MNLGGFQQQSLTSGEEVCSVLSCQAFALRRPGDRPRHPSSVRGVHMPYFKNKHHLYLNVTDARIRLPDQQDHRHTNVSGVEIHLHLRVRALFLMNNGDEPIEEQRNKEGCTRLNLTVSADHILHRCDQVEHRIQTDQTQGVLGRRSVINPIMHRRQHKDRKSQGTFDTLLSLSFSLG